MFTSYMDASLSGDRNIIAVGGFLMKEPDTNLFKKEWSSRIAQDNLTFFHMSECCTRPKGTPYTLLGRHKCDALIKDLINILKARLHAWCAVSVTVTEHTDATRDWSRQIGRDWLAVFGHAFNSCLMRCVGLVKSWADEVQYHGPINYIFEAGDEYQSEANRSMLLVCRHPILRKEYRYGSHEFRGKENESLQGADAIAYEWRADRENQFESESIVRPRRLSLQALLRRPNRVIYLRNYELNIFFRDSAELFFSDKFRKYLKQS